MRFVRIHSFIQIIQQVTGNWSGKNDANLFGNSLKLFACGRGDAL